MRKQDLLFATSMVGLVSLTAPGIVSSAQAQQTAERVTLEEIVVTARKVEENLMQVPLAVTAFSSKDIDAMGVKQMNDVSMFTPSFHFINQVGGGSGSNTRSTNALTFRGLYLGNNVGATAGGLVFIDGTPIISGKAPSAADADRIEVLKGPQSAYFGRSTFIGAVNFVMREPGDSFKGRVTAEASSYGSNDETVSLEGPIVRDKVSIRVGIEHYYRGGQWTNAADPSQKFGEQSTRSLSTSVVAKPSDALKMKVFLNYAIDDDGPDASAAIKRDQFNCVFTNVSTVANANRPSGGYYCGAIPNANQLGIL